AFHRTARATSGVAATRWPSVVVAWQPTGLFCLLRSIFFILEPARCVAPCSSTAVSSQSMLVATLLSGWRSQLRLQPLGRCRS
ncbi:unnamed protein product, partial [Polarella glacialis]